MSMFMYIFCLCPLSLTITLNFIISKVAYLLGVYLDVKTCEGNYFLFCFVAIVRFSCSATRIIVLKRRYKKKKGIHELLSGAFDCDKG